MSETTPNSKGPAKTQMSPEQMARLGLTPTPEATAPLQPTPVPASEVKPEEVGTLTLEYKDGQPVLTVRGGRFIPNGIPVLDASGTQLASYSDLSVLDQHLGIMDITYASAWQLGK
ncbi:MULTISPECIES: hypothetical protein [unclassified Kitasatospora]|uniref:hypothetical protein n=1 Tax=unclassified Kitasatospora TaxID=2633591 RepID=UPI001ADFC09C|nr:hypothetical protein [Kitasatospora sp. RG8]MBP0452800.1 hypothetical protein [Kitasatospora sp. RG8]